MEITNYIKEEIQNTPTYIFDYDNFTHRCNMIKSIVGNEIKLCYSMKANPFLIIDLPKCIDKIEVCSHGEFYICKKLGIDPLKIFYSGVNKKKYEVDEAIEYGVCSFTAESIKHIDILNQTSSTHKVKLNVYIRLCSDSQFGMPFEIALDILKNKKRYSNLNFKGLHFFTGTQKKNSEVIIKEIAKLKEIVNNLRQHYCIDIEEVEYGTGLFIEYFGDAENDLSRLNMIKDELLDLQNSINVTIEMGRYFASTSGIYVTKIDDVKTNDGVNYLIVDGGMNHLVYDGQLKGMRKPKIEHIKYTTNSTETSMWTICGSLCTTNDVLVRDFPLINPQIGDLLCFHNVGAYSFMEGMTTFLSREIPEVLGIKNGELLILRKMQQSYVLNTSTWIKK